MNSETIITFIKNNSIDIKKTSIPEIVKKYNESQLFLITEAVKDAVDFISKDNNSLVKFQEGKTYSTNSICDSDCWFVFRIERRTEKSVWIKDGKKIVRHKIHIWDGVENIKPYGTYSMAPILRATDFKSNQNSSKDDELKMKNDMINSITKRVVQMVNNGKDYNISTACFIDNEFVLVSEYDLNNEYYEALKLAAKKVQKIQDV